MSSVSPQQEPAVFRAVELMADEVVDFLRGLTRIPTINPPGEEYRAGAEFIGAKLKEFGYSCQGSLSWRTSRMNTSSLTT